MGSVFPWVGENEMELPPQLLNYMNMQNQIFGGEVPIQQELQGLRADYLGVNRPSKLSNMGGWLGMIGSQFDALRSDPDPVSIRDMDVFDPFFKSAYTPGGIAETAARDAFQKTESDILANLPGGGAQQELLASNMRKRNQALAQIPAQDLANQINMEQQIANMLITGTPLNQNFMNMSNTIGNQITGVGMGQASGNQQASLANDMAMWNVAKNSIPGGKK